MMMMMMTTTTTTTMNKMMKTMMKKKKKKMMMMMMTMMTTTTTIMTMMTRTTRMMVRMMSKKIRQPCTERPCYALQAHYNNFNRQPVQKTAIINTHTHTRPLLNIYLTLCQKTINITSSLPHPTVTPHPSTNHLFTFNLRLATLG